MNKEEIKLLQERTYAISNSLFPLNTFFNDIRDNDNPRFGKDLAYQDLKLIVDEFYRLREKIKIPTIDEVKKEWEDIGYEWFENGGIIVLQQQIQYTNKYVIITINLGKKAYWKIVDDNLNFIPFSFQEHQLLTKTFAALGWEV